MEPSLYLEWTRLGVVVKTHLFGPVSEARYEEEKKMNQHRAEQLEVQFPRPNRDKPKRNRPMGLAEGFDHKSEWEE